MSDGIKAWCVDRPSGTLVVIGTRADAEERASVMKAAGKEELMLNGPYDFVDCRHQCSDDCMVQGCPVPR